MELSFENNCLDIEIRKLPPRNIFDLSQILELGEAWKELMAIVPNEENPVLLKYNHEHMRMIEDAADKERRTCSEIFLEEWSTSGCKRPKLSYLHYLLTQAELYRAADYILINLLKGKPELRSVPLDLPDIGDLHLPTAPPLETEESLTSEETINLQETVQISQEDSGLDIEGVKKFTYKEFFEGTNKFSTDLKLGEGGFGSVYLCKLPAENHIAVKRLHTFESIPGVSELQFRNELLTVTQFSHPNLLPLVGYSTDGPEPCLAYYYMVNGSLQDRLELKEGSKVLSWEERYIIACGTAEGLVHLHSFTVKPLVHRDVKSANILLDENLKPKVGDFGLARLGANAQNSKTIAKTTTVLGTSAYMAPEAFRGDVSVKMDVFSFGVVLLELVTGLPPFDEERDGCDLASHVAEVDDYSLLIDPKVGQPESKIPRGMYDIAQLCLQEKKNRPNMVATLKLLQDLTEN